MWPLYDTSIKVIYLLSMFVKFLRNPLKLTEVVGWSLARVDVLIVPADVGGVQSEAGRQFHVAEEAMPPGLLRRDALHWIVH